MLNAVSGSSLFAVGLEPDVVAVLQHFVAGSTVHVHRFDSSGSFMRVRDQAGVACLLIDSTVGGLGETAVLEQLHAEQSSIASVALVGPEDVTIAIRAFKSGAVDVLVKPVSEQALIGAVCDALAVSSRSAEKKRRVNEASAKIDCLSSREREVMRMVVGGQPNKQIAVALHLSPKTIEAHRANVMRKMRAESLPDLVQMAILVEADPAGPFLGASPYRVL